MSNVAKFDSRANHTLERLGRLVNITLRIIKHPSRVFNLFTLDPQASQDVYADILGLQSDTLGVFQPARRLFEGLSSSKETSSVRCPVRVIRGVLV